MKSEFFDTDQPAFLRNGKRVRLILLDGRFAYGQTILGVIEGGCYDLVKTWQANGRRCLEADESPFDLLPNARVTPDPTVDQEINSVR